MAREKIDYRDNLASILEFTDRKHMLTGLQVAEYTGLCFNTVKKLFSFKGKYISAETLAREMSSMGGNDG